MDRPLTEKQSLFAKYYYTPGGELFGNATQSYRKAYPKCKSDNAAGVQATRLLSNTKIIAEKGKLQAETRQKMSKTAQDVINELEKLAFETTNDKASKIRSLELLGKYWKLWTEAGAAQQPLQINISSDKAGPKLAAG